MLLAGEKTIELRRYPIPAHYLGEPIADKQSSNVAKLTIKPQARYASNPAAAHSTFHQQLGAKPKSGATHSP